MRTLSLRLEGSRSPDGAVPGEGGVGGETIFVGRPSLLELRLSLSRLAALQEAERREETSGALAALGRKLGRLLPLAAPGAGREPERVRLDLRDQALQALPWELATGLDGALLFAPGSAPLIRGEAGLRPPGREEGTAPLAVSLLAEAPIHFGLADLSGSVAAIREVFREGSPDATGAEAHLSCGSLGTATPARRPVRVLHLIGHGYETSGIDARFEYGVHCASLRDTLPEDTYGEAPARDVASALARHAPAEALLLDACYSGGGFRWDGERWRDPLSTRIAGLGASVAVSFFDAMKTAKAQDFARSFYERFLAGEEPLAAALAAREALYLAEEGSPLHDCAWWRVRIAAAG